MPRRSYCPLTAFQNLYLPFTSKPNANHSPPQVFTHKNGRSAGCATIEFKQHVEACQALLHMRTSTLHGKDIEIQWFNPHLAADPAYKAKASAGEHHHSLGASPRIGAGYNNFNLQAMQNQQALFPHVYNAAAEAAAMVQQAAVQHAMQQEIVAAAAAAAAYQEAVQQAAMQHAVQSAGSGQHDLLASMYAANAAAAAVVAQAAGHQDHLANDLASLAALKAASEGSEASHLLRGMSMPLSVRTGVHGGHMSPELGRADGHSQMAQSASAGGRHGSPYGFQQQSMNSSAGGCGAGAELCAAAACSCCCCVLHQATCVAARAASLASRGHGQHRCKPPCWPAHTALAA
jgi:hypothetical protein